MNETRIGLEMFTSLKAAANHCRIINDHENSFKLLPTRCCITDASSTSKSNQKKKEKKKKTGRKTKHNSRDSTKIRLGRN
mgnify:CR=1 FL=1